MLRGWSVRSSLTVMTLNAALNANVDTMEKIARCVVCPIMVYAHSGPVYLAFRLQRFGLCCWTGESWFPDTAMVITETHTVYKYEQRTHLASLHVNSSHRQAQITSVRHFWFKFLAGKKMKENKHCCHTATGRQWARSPVPTDWMQLVKLNHLIVLSLLMRSICCAA